MYKSKDITDTSLTNDKITTSRYTIPPPLRKGYTIYICDDLYLEDKETFFDSMQEYTKKSHKTFPIIFNNGEFIGGYSEVNALFTQEYKTK